MAAYLSWLEHSVHTRSVTGSSPVAATMIRRRHVTSPGSSRPVGQVVKTRPFHGCNMGSNPVRVTNLSDVVSGV